MWSQELARSYTSVADLGQAGLLSLEEAEKLTCLGERFKVRITPYYAGLMTQAVDCPIRLQAIPGLGEEDPELPAWARQWSQRIYGRPEPWTGDAIGDVQRLAAPRLTHRYDNRAILHLSTLCAVYCRFCFRKEHLSEREAQLYEGSLDPAFDYLANHTEIRELILTGGDPLSVTDAALERVLERVAGLSHIKVLRIHTRMAVTLPARLTAALAETLSRPRNGGELHVHLVSHFNHPREWTREARQGLALMRRSGITLFNQNVLMARVNDSAETLRELYQGLYEEGVVPMYLHHADWTPGTFHFRTSIERGQELVRSLRGVLPGAAIPHYVLDLPGGHGKTSLLDPAVRRIDQWRDASHEGSMTGSIQGAVYELGPTRTRLGVAQQLYLDLWGDRR